MTRLIQMDNVKRLNYLVGEDFYFLTYSILSALDAFSPREGSTFKDHRKLSHLVQLVSDDRLLSILSRYMGRNIENAIDRELLFATFTRGEVHKREVYKLLFALEKRGYVTLFKAAKPEVLDVLLRHDQLPAEFLTSPIFEGERVNAHQLKKLLPRISTMTHETFVERIYSSRGLRVWVV